MVRGEAAFGGELLKGVHVVRHESPPRVGVSLGDALFCGGAASLRAKPRKYELDTGGRVNRPLSRRPRDVNQLAASIVRDSTEDTPAEPHPDGVEDTAVRRENGRRGGLKGGKARADKLSAEERSAIAKRAARTRWGNRG